jgi:hypothetical protein
MAKFNQTTLAFLDSMFVFEANLFRGIDSEGTSQPGKTKMENEAVFLNFVQI